MTGVKEERQTDIDIDWYHVVGQKLGVDCRDKVRHIEIKRELLCATTFTLRACGSTPSVNSSLMHVA